MVPAGGAPRPSVTGHRSRYADRCRAQAARHLDPRDVPTSSTEVTLSHSSKLTWVNGNCGLFRIPPPTHGLARSLASLEPVLSLPAAFLAWVWGCWGREISKRRLPARVAGQAFFPDPCRRLVQLIQFHPRHVFECVFQA